MPGSRKFPPLQRCFCDSSSLPHSTLHCTGPCTYHIGIYHCQIFQDIETSPSYWVKLLVRRISIMESHDTKVEEEQNYNRPELYARLLSAIFVLQDQMGRSSLGIDNLYMRLYTTTNKYD